MSQASASRPRDRRVLALATSLLLVGLSVVCAAVLAVSGSFGTATGSAAPPVAPGGHHVVHDVHCESFTGAEAAAAVHRSPADHPPFAAGPGVSGNLPTDRTQAASAGCAANNRSPATPGREVLLAGGVNRN
ncbi:hypothetical protein GCM10010472_30570 [Pseudonocardia halophobica]|uniref:Uncharacterized protein n=1 Tax=Pseudonocardia halophobica TaxID=29401 RepID=A0A9W6KWI3_9PSEU|nr:hypothetical protein GCM10017577_04560 [Pseudonocardia halophobica]